MEENGKERKKREGKKSIRVEEKVASWC